jgi:pimeloyl-ACP methyl ester carboxylesterase
MQPETKYAWLGPDRIAYQVLGDGPPDLVVCFGFFGQVDIAWEDPGLALFFRTLPSFSRLILFDRRGSGASDPVVLDSLPPWEAYVEDLEAVLDQVGSERAAIMAHVDGGAMALLFAATRPERTSALVLVNCAAKSGAPRTTRSESPSKSRAGTNDPGGPAVGHRRRGLPAEPVTNGLAAGRPSISGPSPALGPSGPSPAHCWSLTRVPFSRWCRHRLS